MASFDEEIDKMKKEAEWYEKARKGKLSVKTEFGPTGGVSTVIDVDGLPIHHSVTNLMGHRDFEADQEEAARYLMKQEMKQSSIFSQAQNHGWKNPSQPAFSRTFTGAGLQRQPDLFGSRPHMDQYNSTYLAKGSSAGLRSARMSE